MANLSDFVSGSGGGGGLTEKVYTAKESLNKGDPVALNTDGSVETISGNSESSGSNQTSIYQYHVNSYPVYSQNGIWAAFSMNDYSNGERWDRLFKVSIRTDGRFSGTPSNSNALTGSNNRIYNYSSYTIDNSGNAYGCWTNTVYGGMYLRKNNQMLIQDNSNSNRFVIGVSHLNGSLYLVTSKNNNEVELLKVNDSTGAIESAITLTNSRGYIGRVVYDEALDKIVVAVNKNGGVNVYYVDDTTNGLAKIAERNAGIVNGTGMSSFSAAAYNGDIVVKYSVDLVGFKFDGTAITAGNRLTESDNYGGFPQAGDGSNSSMVSHVSGNTFAVNTTKDNKFVLYTYKVSNGVVSSSEKITSTNIVQSSAATKVFVGHFNKEIGVAHWMGMRGSEWDTYPAYYGYFKPPLSNASNYLGLVSEDATQGSDVTVKLTGGVLEGLSGISAGADYFVNKETGALDGLPDTGVFVGQGLDSSSIYVNERLLATASVGSSSVIKSVQRGSGGVSASSGSITISPVNLEKSFLTWRSTQSHSTYSGSRHEGYLSNSTTISFTRTYNSGTSSYWWEVIEYV